MSVAAGREEIDKLKFAGFSGPEISNYQAEQTQKLVGGGFSTQEIKDYWGETEPDTGPIKDYVRGNIDKEMAKTEEGKPKEALGFFDALNVGWENSVTGLMSKEPEMILPENSSRAMKIGSMIGTLAGDIPAMAAGGFLGGMAGAHVGGAVGTAVFPGVGTLGGIAGGGVVGGGAGAFGLPAAMRTYMMDHYKKGTFKSSSDFMDTMMSASWDAIKHGAVGGASMGLGRAVGLGAKALGVGARAQSLSAVSSEIGTMTTLGAAVEGHLPEPDDFINNALLIGGFHGIGLASNKLMSIYAEKGMRPGEVIESAKTDPVLKQEILSKELAIVDGPKIQVKSGETAIDYPATKIERKELKLVNEKIPRTEAELSMLSRIGEQPTIKESFDPVKLYKNYVDDLHPLNQLTKLVYKENKIPDELNPYVLSSTYRGWHSLVDRNTRFNTFSFKDKVETGEGLLPILKDIPGGDIDGAKSYGIARRALEKSEQEIVTGVDLEQAKIAVKEGKKFDPILKRLTSFGDRMVDYAVEAGLKSKEDASSMKEMNRSWFPFHRIMDIDPFETKRSGSGLFKKMTGSESKIVDPIDTLYKNSVAIVRASERNRVYESLVKMSETTTGEQFIREVKKDIKPIKVKETEVAKLLDELGVDPEVEAAPYLIFRAKDHIVRDNQFTWYDKGKARHFEVLPEYAEAINALDVNVGQLNLLQKIGKPFTDVKRFVITKNPAFQFFNLIRDQQVGAIQSKNGLKPFVDSARFLGSLFKEDKAYQEFLSSGGATGAYGEGMKLLEQNIYKLNKETGFMNHVHNVIKNPLESVDMLTDLARSYNKFSNQVEQVTRYTEYRLAKEGGKSQLRAAIDAREITVDFAKGSARSRAFNTVTAFFNANLVSVDKMFSSFSPENYKRTVINGLTYSTVPSLLLWWANKDDSRYTDAPSWLKNTFFMFPTDSWEPATSPMDLERAEDLKRFKDGKWEVNNGTVYRIPKGFSYGILFGSLFENTVDAFYRKDPKAFNGFTESILDSLSVNVMPDAILPFAEQQMNKVIFTKKPIVPNHLQDVNAELQQTHYTSETAKLLGKMISAVPYLRDLGPKSAPFASPMVLDNFIKSWGGPLGQYALDVVDSGLTSTGIAKTSGEAPTKTVSDYPIIKAFVMRNPSYQMQPIQDFYEEFDRRSKQINSVRFLAKSGKIDEAQELSNNNLDDMMNLGGVKDTISNLNKMIQKVNEDDKMSGADKRQLMDNYYYMMIEVAKKGNELFKNTKVQKPINRQRME